MSDRPSGSYGLRRAAAPKKHDSDFEYYYTKSKSSEAKVKLESASSNELYENLECSNSPKRRLEGQVTQNVDEQVSLESPSKKSRGRPRKNPLQVESLIQDVTDLDENYVNLKSKQDKRLIKEERVENSNTVESVIEKLENEIGQELLVEEVISQNDTHVIISSVDDEELRQAQEIIEVQQAVVSLPQQDEKENQPNDVESMQEGTGEEMLILGLGSDEDCPITELAEVRVEVGVDGIEIPMRKIKRKYRRIKSTPETIRHLKDFGAEDKIECHECHKLLKPSSFRQHLKTHSGIKPFGCEVCDARFTRKGDVERHIRIVHNKQKPFSCHRCIRSFGDKKNLRWHLMNHDKKLFYVCETCGFKFGKKEYYENHVRFIHPMADDENFEEESVDDNGDLPEAMLSSSLHVDCEEGTSNAEHVTMHTYTPSGYVIKKGENLISVIDPTDAETDTLEISEAQLQQLLHQSSLGKHLTIINPKRHKQTGDRKIDPSRTSSTNKRKQNLTPKTYQETDSPTLSSKELEQDSIEAVVIQIGNSGDNDASESMEQDQVLLINDEEHTSNTVPAVEGQSIDRETVIIETNDNVQAHDEEKPKEVNIVVSKSSIQDSSETNVQSLIDALLHAAKDGSEPSSSS